MLQEMDFSGYASREDRQLILGGSSVWTFTVAGNLSWDAALDILCTITGLRCTLPAGNVDLEDGEALYVSLTRNPRTNVILTAQVGSVPSSDNDYVICVRFGDTVYFRTGLALSAGSSVPLLLPASSLSTVWAGGRETWNSEATPLISGAFAFNPSDYNISTGLVFRAMAANGNPSLTNYVRLWNVTDDEQVAQLEFTTTEIAKDEATLVIGSGPGEIDTTEHVYEVRTILGATPTDPNDTIELYSAELRVK
jgi:hypothetical protein